MKDSREVEFDPSGGDTILVGSDKQRKRVVLVDGNTIMTIPEYKNIQCLDVCAFCVYSKQQIDYYNIYILLSERRKLGIFDKNGNEWRYGDEAEVNGVKCFVFGGRKSFTEYKRDYILIKDNLCKSGWTAETSIYYEIIRNGKKLEKANTEWEELSLSNLKESRKQPSLNPQAAYEEINKEFDRNGLDCEHTRFLKCLIKALTGKKENEND